MALSWAQVNAVIQVPDRVYKLKRAGKGGWMLEYSGIRDDPEEATQDEFRDRECMISIHN